MADPGPGFVVAPGAVAESLAHCSVVSVAARWWVAGPPAYALVGRAVPHEHAAVAGAGVLAVAAAVEVFARSAAHMGRGDHHACQVRVAARAETAAEDSPGVGLGTANAELEGRLWARC